MVIEDFEAPRSVRYLKDVLDGDVQVVGGAVDGVDVDVVGVDGRHLQLLDAGDARLGVEDDQVDLFQAGHAVTGRRARVAGRAHQNLHAALLSSSQEPRYPQNKNNNNNNSNSDSDNNSNNNNHSSVILLDIVLKLL